MRGLGFPAVLVNHPVERRIRLEAEQPSDGRDDGVDAQLVAQVVVDPNASAGPAWYREAHATGDRRGPRLRCLDLYVDVVNCSQVDLPRLPIIPAMAPLDARAAPAVYGVDASHDYPTTREVRPHL